MSKELTIRFKNKDITWITDKTYKAKQTQKYYFDFPFCFEEDWGVINSCGYKHPNLFKGRCVLSAIFNKYLDLIVWDAEKDQISIPTTGFKITVDLPTSTKTSLKEEVWWDRVWVKEKTLKKVLIILAKLGYLTMSKTKAASGYTRINLNISKCNRSLVAGRIRHDIIMENCFGDNV